MRKGALSAEDLIEHVDKDSYALVLLPSGCVHKVEDGRVWPAERGLVSIGSGGDLALGWLTCYEWKHGGFFGGPDGNVVRRAFEFVSKKRSDCGGGVDFRSFER